MNARTTAAIDQIFEWARAWVENETAIPECKASDLNDAEKGALIIMDLWEQKK